MTTLERQIQAANKRIAKYEKNVDMYSQRVDKHIDKFRKKGYDLSREDFQVTKDPKWKYSFDIEISDRLKQQMSFNQWYPVTDALHMQHENAARLENERILLAGLMERQQMSAQREADNRSVDGVLSAKLTEALQPFRIQWTESMMQWHAAFYIRIHEKLPDARQQLPYLKQLLDTLKYEHGWYSRHPDIVEAENRLKNVSRILAAKPVSFDTQDGYLAYIRPRLDEEFDGCIATLAAKCRPFSLDVQQVQVHHTRMGERGFDVLLTDGKDRVVDARAIWAAEDSAYVTPHTRYIITERRTPVRRQVADDVPSLSAGPSFEGKAAAERITDIAVIRQNIGYGIRCKVDGVQQMARSMNMLECKEYETLQQAGDNEALKAFKIKMAESYFPDTLSVGVEPSRGVRR